MTSLYVHIPFCEKKCLYCSFVVAVAQEKRMNAYIQALNLEVRQYKGMDIASIYLGGGTPTFLNNEELRETFSLINNNFNVKPQAEITVEANPEDINEIKIETIKDLGVNRVSLGIQSFNDRYLVELGRVHDSEKAVKAFKLLKASGFKNISIDLMFGFPSQSIQDLENDLSRIIELEPSHISIYALTVEPNSRFFVQGVLELEGDLQALFYEHIIDCLLKNGFRQYEISNFSREGFQSVHNKNYWLGGNYIGLGVGAHSHQHGKRWSNITKLSEYIKRINDGHSVIKDEIHLTEKERFKEKILFGLRMNDGIDYDEFKSMMGVAFDSIQIKNVERFIQEGFLIKEKSRLKCTPKGRLVLDEISCQLI